MSLVDWKFPGLEFSLDALKNVLIEIILSGREICNFDTSYLA
ncbi:hypothetical protein ANT_26170 [Anaerolinea thermophila UNI-1]|uniref:Uncharacterized protein n=1 Tax=Anaerolinea thermophila (strain DSM 14523 / JCM 11388 / NBRC 100420 / UNI-1) TaxID=926569 RepID=E8N094_ANATU|nr:hypothetical protein ANT_26170 [Anaerolinea thermophila UNI-1]